MDVQVELIHRRHGYRKEIVLVRRIDEDLRAAFELALRGFLDQDQRAAIAGCSMIASVCQATSVAVWRRK